MTTAYMYPDPLPIDSRIRIPRLDYHGKLLLNGELLQGIATDQHSPYAIYRAKMYQDEPGGEVEVVVKFTVRYNEEAHRILAKSQLAPTLHFCIPLVSGMHMTIMDYIESAPLPFTFGFDHQAVYSDVETAVKLLHEQDLVFGDLRVQNVLLKPGGGAMLIDFDWVGKHRVDRYPASWNSDNVEVPGVDRTALMEKAHDLFLLKELQKHAEYLAVE